MVVQGLFHTCSRTTGNPVIEWFSLKHVCGRDEATVIDRLLRLRLPETALGWCPVGGFTAAAAGAGFLSLRVNMGPSWRGGHAPGGT